jgi:hypothetical protein
LAEAAKVNSRTLRSSPIEEEEDEGKEEEEEEEAMVEGGYDSPQSPERPKAMNQ